MISAEAIKKLENAPLERAYLKGLMTYFDAVEGEEALLKTKSNVFSTQDRVKVFEAILALFDKGSKYSTESVGLVIQSAGVDEEFVKILQTEETPNFIFVLTGLTNLARSRRAYSKLMDSMKQIVDNVAVNGVLQNVAEYIDHEFSEDSGELRYYDEIKKDVLNQPPEALYSTGLVGLDKQVMLKLGTFGVILAAPEVGKSTFLEQMAEAFANENLNCKSMIFPFEFTSENYVRKKMNLGRDTTFEHKKLIVEDRSTDLGDLRIKILQGVRAGVLFFGIDSQMSLQDNTHIGRDESLERKKFELLSSLAIRHNIIIFIIAQETIGGKKGSIYGSSMASYLPKIILYIDYKDDTKTTRKLISIKNKLNGTQIDLDMELVPKTLKFNAVYENMQGTVGRKRNDDNEPVEYIYEEADKSDEEIAADLFGSALDLPVV